MIVLDWIASALTLIAVYLLAKHPQKAVMVFIASSVSFLVWALYREIWSIVLMQSILIFLNVRTLYVWRQNGQ
jgi:dolichyl-phosphate-mannose--protein O-mannosyl transferase